MMFVGCLVLCSLINAETVRSRIGVSETIVDVQCESKEANDEEHIAKGPLQDDDDDAAAGSEKLDEPKNARMELLDVGEVDRSLALIESNMTGFSEGKLSRPPGKQYEKAMCCYLTVGDTTLFKYFYYREKNSRGREVGDYETVGICPGSWGRRGIWYTLAIATEDCPEGETTIMNKVGYSEAKDPQIGRVSPKPSRPHYTKCCKKIRQSTHYSYYTWGSRLIPCGKYHKKCAKRGDDNYAVWKKDDHTCNSYDCKANMVLEFNGGWSWQCPSGTTEVTDRMTSRHCKRTTTTDARNEKICNLPGFTSQAGFPEDCAKFWCIRYSDYFTRHDGAIKFC